MSTRLRASCKTKPNRAAKRSKRSHRHERSSVQNEPKPGAHERANKACKTNPPGTQPRQWKPVMLLSLSLGRAALALLPRATEQVADAFFHRLVAVLLQ